MQDFNWLLYLQAKLGFQSRRQHGNRLFPRVHRGLGPISDPTLRLVKRTLGEVCIGNGRRFRATTGSVLPVPSVKPTTLSSFGLLCHPLERQVSLLHLP
jgi:hypothetical protein